VIHRLKKALMLQIELRIKTSSHQALIPSPKVCHALREIKYLKKPYLNLIPIITDPRIVKRKYPNDTNGKE